MDLILDAMLTMLLEESMSDLHPLPFDLLSGRRWVEYHRE
jgi:hypothetical protein